MHTHVIGLLLLSIIPEAALSSTAPTLYALFQAMHRRTQPQQKKPETLLTRGTKAIRKNYMGGKEKSYHIQGSIILKEASTWMDTEELMILNILREKCTITFLRGVLNPMQQT